MEFISNNKASRLIANAFAVSIVTIFLSKIFPSDLRNVIVRLTSEILRFSNQYPKK